MIISKGMDVECFPNMFSITFVDLKDYLDKFADCVDISVDKNGKEKRTPVPITNPKLITFY